MPQARSSGSGSSSGAGRGQSKRSTSGSSRASSSRASSSRASASKGTGSSRGSTSRAGAAKASAPRARSASAGRTQAKGATETATARARATAGAAEQRLEQVAQRLRKLNERIIEAGKDAGETTLTSYEKALKAIATSIERGPGSSEVDWISNLATTQAKFIRDVTTAWTNAAREMLTK